MTAANAIFFFTIVICRRRVNKLDWCSLLPPFIHLSICSNDALRMVGVRNSAIALYSAHTSIPLQLCSHWRFNGLFAYAPNTFKQKYANSIIGIGSLARSLGTIGANIVHYTHGACTIFCFSSLASAVGGWCEWKFNGLPERKKHVYHMRNAHHNANETPCCGCCCQRQIYSSRVVSACRLSKAYFKESIY